jgi:hypothetical protein
LPVGSGGTGATSNSAAPFALKGANSDITSLSGLTTELSIGQGGTGQTTATAAFNALNPMTTTGDIIYEASPTTAARLPIGSTGQVLTVSGGIPAWATPAGGSNVQTFTSSGTWTKPSSGTVAAVLLVGGGGGGGRNNGSYSSGGAGGGVTLALYLLADLPSTVAVTIGSGGAASSGFSVSGGNGGITSFGTIVKSYGGGGAISYNNSGDPSPAPPVIVDAASLIDTATIGRVGAYSKVVTGNSAFQLVNNQILGNAGQAVEANGATGQTIAGGNYQNFLGTGGNVGATGSGFGAGGGTGGGASGAGTSGYCKVTVW